MHCSLWLFFGAPSAVIVSQACFSLASSFFRLMRMCNSSWGMTLCFCLRYFLHGDIMACYQIGQKSRIYLLWSCPEFRHRLKDMRETRKCGLRVVGLYYSEAAIFIILQDAGFGLQWPLLSMYMIYLYIVPSIMAGSVVVLFLPRPSNRVRNCLCEVRSSNYSRVDWTRRSRSFYISWRQGIYI